MPYDETLIANMAIGHCGISIAIGDLATENSNEAVQCRRFFDHCRDSLYRMKLWSFANNEVALADLGVTGTVYEDRWLYRYMYPNFAIRINSIINPAIRTPATADDKIPYEIAYNPDSGGKVILSDAEDAIAEYNHLIEDVTFWDADFAEADSLYLGMRIAPALKVDAGIIQEIRGQWQLFLDNTMSITDSEDQPDPEAPSEFETVRG